jgi:hypothetical protein
VQQALLSQKSPMIIINAKQGCPNKAPKLYKKKVLID